MGVVIVVCNTRCGYAPGHLHYLCLSTALCLCKYGYFIRCCFYFLMLIFQPNALLRWMPAKTCGFVRFRVRLN